MPERAHRSILVTTRNKQVGIRLSKGASPIEVTKLDDDESVQLLEAAFNYILCPAVVLHSMPETPLQLPVGQIKSGVKATRPQLYSAAGYLLKAQKLAQ